MEVHILELEEHINALQRKREHLLHIFGCYPHDWERVPFYGIRCIKCGKCGIRALQN